MPEQNFPPTVRYEVLGPYFLAWDYVNEAQMRLLEKDLSAPFDALKLLQYGAICAKTQVKSLFKPSQEKMVGLFEVYLASAQEASKQKLHDVYMQKYDRARTEYELSRVTCDARLQALEAYLRAIKEVLEAEHWLSPENVRQLPR